MHLQAGSGVKTRWAIISIYRQAKRKSVRKDWGKYCVDLKVGQLIVV